MLLEALEPRQPKLLCVADFNKNDGWLCLLDAQANEPVNILIPQVFVWNYNIASLCRRNPESLRNSIGHKQPIIGNSEVKG